MRGWSGLLLGFLMTRPASAQSGRPRMQDPTAWLGCYILSWRAPQRTITDSIRIVWRTRSTPAVLAGFRLAWSDSGGFNAPSAPSVEDEPFMGPGWALLGDSLLITEGILTTSRIVIHRGPNGLVGRIEVRYDSGPPPGYTASVTVERVPCPPSGEPPLWRVPVTGPPN